MLPLLTIKKYFISSKEKLATTLQDNPMNIFDDCGGTLKPLDLSLCVALDAVVQQTWVPDSSLSEQCSMDHTRPHSKNTTEKLRLTMLNPDPATF